MHSTNHLMLTEKNQRIVSSARVHQMTIESLDDDDDDSILNAVDNLAFQAERLLQKVKKYFIFL
jgi:hypothetical protein